MNNREILRSATHRVNWTAQTISATILLIAVLVLLLRPVFRYFHILTLWIEPLVQLITVWITFLMLGKVETSDRHIKIEYFVNRIGEHRQKYINSLTVVLGGYVTASIMISSLFATINLGQATITGLPVNTWILHVVPLVGMLLLSLNYLQDSLLILTDTLDLQ